jgi:tight adherence protein B
VVINSELLESMPTEFQDAIAQASRNGIANGLEEMGTAANTACNDLRDKGAELSTMPDQIIIGSACLVLLGYSLTLFWIPRVWAGAIVGLTAGSLPYVFLRILRGRRLNKFEEQFPEAVDLIARTLRAGHAFTTGLRLAADELPEPVATEFKLLHDQQNYGLPMTAALREFADRVPLIDARFFVTAVLTQREAGGNLAEVLDNLSAVIRERFKIKRQLRVVSAHGRLTGAVLGALPPSLGAFLLIRTPDHFKILIEEPAGIRMIIVAVSLQLLGVFMIYKITKVEY